MQLLQTSKETRSQSSRPVDFKISVAKRAEKLTGMEAFGDASRVDQVSFAEDARDELVDVRELYALLDLHRRQTLRNRLRRQDQKFAVKKNQL